MSGVLQGAVLLVSVFACVVHATPVRGANGTLYRYVRQSPDPGYTGGATPPSTTTPSVMPPGGWPPSGFGFPNPTQDFTQCDPHAGNSFAICDPEGRLTSSEYVQLESKILEIANGAPCACGSSSSACPSKPRGHYIIGIAVVSRLAGSGSAADRVRQFAEALRMTYWRDLDLCSDLSVIAVATDDRAIFTSIGPEPRKKIPNCCSEEIYDESVSYFSSGEFYNGLNKMLDDYRTPLHGGQCGYCKKCKCGLSVGEIIGIVFGVLAGVGMIVGLIVCCIGFCKDWTCVVDTCIGVCIGMVLGCIQSIINAIIFSCIAAACEAMGCEDCEPCCEPLECVGGDGNDDGFSSPDGGGGAGGDF